MRTLRLSVISSLALGVIAVASVASAEPHKTYGHGAKTQQGFRGRSITNRERRIIAKRRRRMIRLRQHALRDGYVTRREVKKIKRAKRRLHTSIYWARHNDQVRKHPRDNQRDHEHLHGWHDADRYRRWAW